MLNKIFSQDKDLADFINSPLIQPLDRAAALKAAFEGSGVHEDLQSFVLLLAEKNRLGVIKDVELAFQDKADAANGVVRGTVRAAYALSGDEQKAVEDMIQKATGKKVILQFEQDSTVIGGLKAQVGSFTFDDTVDTHLTTKDFHIVALSAFFRGKLSVPRGTSRFA